ncbi:MAG: hypothetical protein R2728_11955 [Chitinophagales bacterium]
MKNVSFFIIVLILVISQTLMAQTIKNKNLGVHEGSEIVSISTQKTLYLKSQILNDFSNDESYSFHENQIVDGKRVINRKQMIGGATTVATLNALSITVFTGATIIQSTWGLEGGGIWQGLSVIPLIIGNTVGPYLIYRSKHPKTELIDI